jgi:hypothetical protein
MKKRSTRTFAVEPTTNILLGGDQDGIATRTVVLEEMELG